MFFFSLTVTHFKTCTNTFSDGSSLYVYDQVPTTNNAEKKDVIGRSNCLIFSVLIIFTNSNDHQQCRKTKREWITVIIFEAMNIVRQNRCDYVRDEWTQVD